MPDGISNTDLVGPPRHLILKGASDCKKRFSSGLQRLLAQDVNKSLRRVAAKIAANRLKTAFCVIGITQIDNFPRRMILVFGATGFTGRMVVESLVALDRDVRIAGRSEEKLQKLSDRLGGLDWMVADVKDPESVRAAAEGCSVLVTTVGPYTWWGHVAADAALDAGIPYIDITGEPGWLRKVFDEYGPRAEAANIAMLPAIGYDYVPGNLAGALALEAAGDSARSIDIGYFLTGENSRSLKSLSGGTLRSLRASGNEEQFAFRSGGIVAERAAKRVIEFKLGSRKATAVSIGSTEHFTLPRLAPQLQDVNAGLGWFGPASRAVSVASALGRQAERIPGVSTVIEKVTGGGQGVRETSSKDAPSGPSEDSRAQARTNVIAVARGADGEELSRVHLDGPNPYDLTGKIVAWSAAQAEDGQIAGTGAIGPVEAFGLEELRQACQEIGLREVQ